jgi:uncharacterized protein
VIRRDAAGPDDLQESGHLLVAVILESRQFAPGCRVRRDLPAEGGCHVLSDVVPALGKAPEKQIHGRVELIAHVQTEQNLVPFSIPVPRRVGDSICASHNTRGTSMGNPVVHFEIHGQDPAVLHEFYRTVFGWTIDANNPMAYGLVNTGSDQGIQGGIATGNGARGVTVYLETDDVKGTLDRAVGSGAEVVMGPDTIPGVVELAQFRDPEGNLIGLTRNLRPQA